MINKRLKDVLFTDQWSEVCMERLSPFGYVLVSTGFDHPPHMHALLPGAALGAQTGPPLLASISAPCVTPALMRSELPAAAVAHFPL